MYLESEKIVIDYLIYKAEIDTQTLRTKVWIGEKVGKGMENELGNWD